MKFLQALKKKKQDERRHKMWRGGEVDESSQDTEPLDTSDKRLNDKIDKDDIEADEDKYYAYGGEVSVSKGPESEAQKTKRFLSALKLRKRP